MIKKLSAMLVLIALSISLVACGNHNNHYELEVDEEFPMIELDGNYELIEENEEKNDVTILYKFINLNKRDDLLGVCVRKFALNNQPLYDVVRAINIVKYGEEAGNEMSIMKCDSWKEKDDYHFIYTVGFDDASSGYDNQPAYESRFYFLKNDTVYEYTYYYRAKIVKIRGTGVSMYLPSCYKEVKKYDDNDTLVCSLQSKNDLFPDIKIFAGILKSLDEVKQMYTEKFGVTEFDEYDFESTKGEMLHAGTVYFDQEVDGVNKNIQELFCEVFDDVFMSLQYSEEVEAVRNPLQKAFIITNTYTTATE